LSASPDSNITRSAVLNAGKVLAQQLNTTTTGVQALRSDAELGLQDAVSRANNAMTRLAQINQQLATATPSVSANLLDDRDRYLDQLAQIMDIRVTENANGQVSVNTNS